MSTDRWKMSSLSEVEKHHKTAPIIEFLNEALNELKKADLTNIDSSRAAIKRATANLIVFKNRFEEDA